MRIKQVAFRFEDRNRSMRLWTVLPKENQFIIARMYARLCARAAKVATTIGEKGKRNDTSK